MERGHSFDYMQTGKDFFSPEYIRHILVKLRPWKGLVLISRLVFTDGERWRRRFCCFCLSQGGTDATLDCGLRRWPEVGFGDIIRWFPRSPFLDSFRIADHSECGVAPRTLSDPRLGIRWIEFNGFGTMQEESHLPRRGSLHCWDANGLRCRNSGAVA
jgi:hypothetical protein